MGSSGINPFTKEPCVIKAKPASKTDEIHEGHEGRKCLDPNRSVCSRSGKSWPEVEGSESCCRRHPRRGGGANEKEWIFQARRRFESEAQEPGGFEGTQGHQPVHQGAVCY